MSDYLDAGWMFNRSEELASSVEKNWLLQVGVGTLALLYSVNSDLAAALSRRLNIDDELVKYLVPFVSVFLFVKGGYFLGEYLRVRKNLLNLMNSLPEGRDLDSSAQANVSVAYVVSALVHKQDFDDAVVTSIGSTNRLQPAANVVSRVVYNLIFLVFMAGQGLSVGTGEYLSSRLVESWQYSFAVVILWQAILVLWTIQFLTTMNPYFGGFKKIYVAAPVVATVIAAWVMVVIDPLDDAPPPPPIAVGATTLPGSQAWSPP